VPRRPAALDISTWVDDEPWRSLPALTDLVLADGSGPAARATRVRLCADDDALWVRFDNDDDDPRATLTERDAPLWTEDVVELFLAPGAETPTVYYEFEVNPLGTLFDARVSNPQAGRDGMAVETEWDCDGITWGASIRRDAAAWSARLRIPWRSIDRGPMPPILRANFFRIDDPLGASAEYSAWSPTLATPPDFHRPAFFGSLLLGGG
jgi:hypothetical protein